MQFGMKNKYMLFASGYDSECPDEKSRANGLQSAA